MINQKHTIHHFLVITILLWIISSCSYLPEEPTTNNTNITIEETPDYIALSPSPLSSLRYSTGILFYPGGLVDPHAYIPTFEGLVEQGHPVVILKVAANLAIANTGKALKEVDKLEQASDWVIAGHSLGGVVAGMAAAEDQEAFEGLIMMAAYSISDLADWEAPVMSLTGAKDALLDEAAFTENESNLPPRLDINSLEEMPQSSTVGQTIYHSIEGGNHAQFGAYGEQAGDATADISEAAQHEEIQQYILAFFEANGWRN